VSTKYITRIETGTDLTFTLRSALSTAPFVIYGTDSQSEGVYIDSCLTGLAGGDDTFVFTLSTLSEDSLIYVSFDMPW